MCCIGVSFHPVTVIQSQASGRIHISTILEYYSVFLAAPGKSAMSPGLNWTAIGKCPHVMIPRRKGQTDEQFFSRKIALQSSLRVYPLCCRSHTCCFPRHFVTRWYISLHRDHTDNYPQHGIPQVLIPQTGILRRAMLTGLPIASSCYIWVPNSWLSHSGLSHS